MIYLVWFLIAFLSGALPFSVWIGRLALGRDIRRYGDHNPGMTNVFRAGGKGWGVVAMLLDGFKGAIPVGLAYWLFRLSGWGMAAIAAAPILGHAFSPFLKFRGGKAVAVTFGVWTGLTLFYAPTLLGIGLGGMYLLLASDAWAVFPPLLILLGGLLGIHAPGWMLGVWAANTLVLLWKHRHDLARPPRLRRWLRRLFHLETA
jgi:acyl phosphate:glycerol-3-phosphate acyltransferase